VSASPLNSPVVVDGIVSDEKLAELLRRQTEYPELDYKATIDLSTTAGRVELAKDVAAMQVRGGYIIGGVDNHGVPTGLLDGLDSRPFDEASLAPMLLKWLPPPLELRTRVAERDGHTIAVIYVGPHPAGCAIFRADGTYVKDDGEAEVVFRAGEVFWRDGTRSVRISQHGLEDIIERRVANVKAVWLEEQGEIRRCERAELEAAYEGRRLTEAPLGAVNFDLPPAELTVAALELLRGGDAIAMRHLLNDAPARARVLIERNEIEAELGDLLDKLACLAAVFLEYGQTDWFDQIIETLRTIYSMPLEQGDAERFGYSTQINAKERAPRVWLLVLERVFGLGAFAARRRNWTAVRTLTLQLPEGLTDYDANWLRHGLTMASRAQHLQEQRQNGRTVELSLLSIARADVARLACLRQDGLSDDDDEILTSLAQFDVLSNLAAIDGAGEAAGRVFYPNFARFRQTRIQPVVDRLLGDAEMRQTIFRGSDEALAIALATIAEHARQQGWMSDGFVGWPHTPVGEFIERHL